MHGKLIVIEGTDGSGKETQARKLRERLACVSAYHLPVSFPRYYNPMCAPVEAYLDGKLGPDVHPYAATMCYLVDQYTSWKMDPWGQYYRNGGLVVADRYLTSSILHQSARLPENERDEFVNWLKNLAYGKCGMPVPDIVIYLHVNPEITDRTLAHRPDKDGIQHDILESDLEYQHNCKLLAKDIAKQENWHVIDCNDPSEKNMLSIQEIHEKIMLEIQNII